MVKINLASSVAATALIALSASYSAHAKPFITGPQTAFQLGDPSAQQSHSSANGGRNAAMEYAMKALTGVSAQVAETFETVMAELGDVSKHMTWSLPKKVVTPRPDGWDATVSSAALPEHSLRVKTPNSLGVDDVKQVIIHTL